MAEAAQPHYNILLGNGVILHEQLDSWEWLNEAPLPARDALFFNLEMSPAAGQTIP